MVVTAPSKAVAGQVVRLSGKGFSPGTTVKIVFDSDSPKHEVVGSAVTQADGQFHASVVVPHTRPGRHVLQVEGTSNSGRHTSWAGRVVVLSDLTRALPRGSSLATPVLLAMSIGLPIVTWLVLQVPWARRRKFVTQPGHRAGGS